VEVIDGRITGRFKTKNCYGPEKVNRIKAVLKGPREDYEIFAFGDSRGDREMLNFADQGFFKPFRD
jgi:phosphoserine phosphatase